MSVKRAVQTVDAAEVGRFDSAMGQWWDVRGPARALQQLNPVRVGFTRDFWGAQERSLRGTTVADVGCGGGLFAEALARLGADVTGVDASPKAIQVASERAKRVRLPEGGGLRYVQASPEELIGEQQFDLVVCSEVIEHVADLESFIESLCKLARHGLVISTLNRTAVSYAAAILGAEYMLGLVPPGTHDWSRFVMPKELESLVKRDPTWSMSHMSGMQYNPLWRPHWSLSSNSDINYIAAFQKQELRD